MLVYPIRPIAPVAKVVRSDKTDQSEEVQAEELVGRPAPPKGRSRREGKSFYQSANERSSSAVQDALLDLPRNR